MSVRQFTSPADYIFPLDINKLEGRMMYIPPPAGKNRNILLIYGHHGVLERWWSLAENLADYGSVTVPDLPGFGGMDSFEKIGKKTDIDDYADYLAAFIKLRFKHKRITLVGVSFGFVVITRMLQLYPELTKKVDLLVSMVGFMHKDDFIYKPISKKIFRYGCRGLAIKPFCFIQRVFFINYPVIKFVYNLAPNSKDRQHRLPKAEHEATVEFEARLWKVNDLRTNWLTMSDFFAVDNCQVRINLPVIHVISKVDSYLDNDIVKQHMLVVFTGYKRYVTNSGSHTPSIIADKKTTGSMLPPALRRTLNKTS